MSSGIYFNACSRECRIGSVDSKPKSTTLSKNMDIIFLVLTVFFTTLSVLLAYDYIPLDNPMFASGCLASAAGLAFIQGVFCTLLNRGFIIVRKSDSPQPQ